MKKVTMIGAGAWGTAVSTVLAANGYTVTLWCYETEVVESIKSTSQNSLFLPGEHLDKKIIPTDSLEVALTDAEYVFFAVPVKFARTILSSCSPFFTKDQVWIFLDKGIEQETLLMPIEIAKLIFKGLNKVVACMGPSFAKDVVRKELTGIVCASENQFIITQVQKLLHNDYFKVVPSDDIIGVQLCAALKNVITLSVGILDGADSADNTKAFFFTQILQEARHILIACNGKEGTLYGLAGIGDIVLTTFGSQSRNLQVGRLIGKGYLVQEAADSMKSSPEGVNTLFSLQKLLEEKQLVCPLIQAIYDVVQGTKTVEELLINL